MRTLDEKEVKFFDKVILTIFLAKNKENGKLSIKVFNNLHANVSEIRLEWANFSKEPINERMFGTLFYI